MSGSTGGGVYVGATVAFNMNGGTEIYGNSAINGGGLYVAGTFTMSDGAVGKKDGANKAENGSGVYVAGGTFSMSGGVVSYNGDTATDSAIAINGGGVYVEGGTFSMSGYAEISNNKLAAGNSDDTSVGGGGVCLVGGTFTIEADSSAVISDNVVENSNLRGGGGVYVADGYTFTMNSGTIRGNSAENKYGGGVYVAAAGDFVMTGGTIGGLGAGNTAAYGAGVCIGTSGESGASFAMTGGSILYNQCTSHSGGVSVAGGTFSVSGSPVIMYNTNTDGTTETANNVYLPDGKTIALDGTLSSDAKIGITIAAAPVQNAPVEVTSAPLSNMTDVSVVIRSDQCYAVANGTNAVEFSVVPAGLTFVPGGTVTGALHPDVDSSASAEYKGVFIEGRTVTLSPFYISKTPVTQLEYELIMGSNPSSFSADPASGEDKYNRPVETVNWYNAIVYCNKLSISENLTPCYTINNSTDPTDWGTVPTSDDDTWNNVTCDFTANGYRLPTEAEWEYAARGGDLDAAEWKYLFSGSAAIEAYDSETNAGLENVGWYRGNSDSKTHQVGLKTSNALGLYDMSGNVWEWCWDWYGDSVSTGSETDPTGPSSGSFRVRRGGSWYDVANNASVCYRYYLAPSYRYYFLGFRLVRNAR